MDLSLAASTFETLRITPPSKLTLLEAGTLSSAHVPPFPADIPALLIGVHSRELALQIVTVLLTVYPPEHEIHIVNAAGLTTKAPSLGDTKKKTFVTLPSRTGVPPSYAARTVRLGDFAVSHRRGAARGTNGVVDRDGDFGFSRAACLYLPSLGDGTSFESFAEIVAHLRAPDGCPWDREQTHQTLRTHLLEEAYETLSAMDANDPESMREEFGDLLLQVVLNSQIAYEAGEFSTTRVIKGINDKLIRRHPHVFGDTKVDGVDGVLQNWEKLKEKERGGLALSGVEGKKKDKGILDGVPAALPALTQAQEYQDRAARVGFDWPEIDGVLDKIREEIEEIKIAETDFELASEIGDLFFVLVNLARWKHVDAESVLRSTNMKFKKRFAFVEQSAKSQGRNLSDMTLEEMDAFWNQAKKTGL